MMNNVCRPVDISVKLLLSWGFFPNPKLTVCLGNTSLLKFSSVHMWLITHFECKSELRFLWVLMPYRKKVKKNVLLLFLVNYVVSPWLLHLIIWLYLKHSLKKKTGICIF